jgi:hypothetical protein
VRRSKSLELSTSYYWVETRNRDTCFSTVAMEKSLANSLSSRERSGRSVEEIE